MKQITILSLFILLYAMPECNSKNSPEVFDLRCENLQDPLGINKSTPRFSWKISSAKNGTEAEVLFPEGVKEFIVNEFEFEIQDEKRGSVILKSGKYKINSIFKN